jgi:hypothetical protein
MTFSTHTELFISRAELKAGAQYQDRVQEMMVAIGKAFGTNVPTEEISTWKKLKIGLGKEVVERKGPVTAIIAKRGVRIIIKIDSELDEKIMVEYFRAIGDIVEIYAPAVTGAVTSIMTANALAGQRAESAAQKISKLLKK